jgi:hypothetical protein
LNSALTVNFAISGTASNGVDCVALTETVTIPAGIATLPLSVNALVDGQAEGEESVTLTILPDPAYFVESPGTATVIIWDAPWDQWRFTHFTAAELESLVISGAEADPDGDGKKNLFEYAIYTDPRTADEVKGFDGVVVPVVNFPTPLFFATFTRRKGMTDLAYEVETTRDLVTWNSGPEYAQELRPAIDDPNGVTQTVRVWIIGFDEEASEMFARLKVSLTNGSGPAGSPPAASSYGTGDIDKR